MNKDQREIQRKLRVLRHADETGHVAKICADPVSIVGDIQQKILICDDIIGICITRFCVRN